MVVWYNTVPGTCTAVNLNVAYNPLPLLQTDCVPCSWATLLQPMAAFVYSKFDSAFCPGSSETELCWAGNPCLQACMQKVLATQMQCDCATITYLWLSLIKLGVRVVDGHV